MQFRESMPTDLRDLFCFFLLSENLFDEYVYYSEIGLNYLHHKTPQSYLSFVNWEATPSGRYKWLDACAAWCVLLKDIGEIY